MAIITVSRQSGSRGDEITDLLVRSLGLRMIDKDTLEEALVRHGIPETSVERYDEKKPGFWEYFSSDRDRYYHYLKASILESVLKGDRIVLGRGAPMILAGVPGVLHLRVIAPMEIRVQRVMEEQACDEHHARRIIHQSDHNREGFYHVFFNADWDAPEHYDLTVNTGSISPEAVLETVRAIIDSSSFQADAKRTEAHLAELAMAQEILNKIIFEEKIPLRFPGVEVHDGTAILTGAVSIAANIERCEATAKAVKGVQRVDSQIACVPESYDGPYM
ncbi:MAG: cytidylate kinase family protein [Alkalispirochaeta sp.]